MPPDYSVAGAGAGQHGSRDGRPAEEPAVEPDLLGLRSAGRAHRTIGDGEYRVDLLGLDVFDPAAMDSDHREGSDVPAWFLDTDYNGLYFHVCQAFFPRTSAWEGLERLAPSMAAMRRHHEFALLR